MLNPWSKGRSKECITLGTLLVFSDIYMYTDVLSEMDKKWMDSQKNRKTMHHQSRCVPEKLWKNQIPTSCHIKRQFKKRKQKNQQNSNPSEFHLQKTTLIKRLTCSSVLVKLRKLIVNSCFQFFLVICYNISVWKRSRNAIPCCSPHTRKYS